ncbi:PqqD family protein [Microbacterium allomyrinae]|uniref:PqqD family protein n=1 Tax=Microbacterium allomyrinae TaxID=2830666 RepID=A0A9X1LRH9_9MICO|nr:PqqD family protein [Microbacterium allomyrinae]MCC2030742.1 PqqD family protein [Microbacterium allomyrinae]
MTAEVLPVHHGEPAVPVRRAAALAIVDSDDRLVVLRLDDERCEPHVLRGTAIALWREIDGERSADAIIEALVERFDADFGTVRRDVLACLDTMRRTGLIEREQFGSP